MNDDIFVRKEVYEAEQKRIDARLDSEGKRIDDLKDSVSRNLALWGWGMTFLAVLIAAMQVGVALMLYLITRSV